MNSFYKQPIYIQWIEAILLLVIGFFPALYVIELAYTQPLFYFTYLIYLPLFQFSATPFFKLTGIYKYYSPMLLGYMPNDIQIDLHSGGSFDYLFVLRKYKMGNELRNRILSFHLEGLLNIIAKIENGEIPKTVLIFGTSYFFNERTIKKLGFESNKPTFFYKLNLYVNFIDLIWMYSISKGKFSIPKLGFAKKVSIEGGNLIKRKEIIEELYKKINLKLT